MTPDLIRFQDGARYDRYMGQWSKLAGDAFLDWLAPAPGLRWLDVGCGNGAFTEMLISRCAPASMHGVDPSSEQLDYARSQAVLQLVQFQQGDAMALPYVDDTFDAAVMPLVIFFVPDPARGIAEMARVVCPGGTVSAYAWDMMGGGFPYEALLAELRGMGLKVPAPPSSDASRLDALQGLWAAAGLEAIDTHVIEVTRTFADFEDYWETALGAPSVGSTLKAMSEGEVSALQRRMRSLLPSEASGRIVWSARANAVKGRVPR